MTNKEPKECILSGMDYFFPFIIIFLTFCARRESAQTMTRYGQQGR